MAKKTKEAASHEYNGHQIEVLEGLMPVRVRPGMYIGNTGSQGLHHLVYEIVDNAVDENLAGYCNEIAVTLYKNYSVSVEDNGRGLPVDLIPNTKDYPKEKYKKGISSERVVLTTLHAGGKFGGGGYKVSGGLHGVGMSVVNALSSYVKVEVFKDGYYYVDEYKNGGIPITELKDGELVPVGKTDKLGTKITFQPDGEIFETLKIKGAILKKRLKELAFLNKGLKITFTDYTLDEVEETVFYEMDGIAGFVKDLNQQKTPIHDIVYFSGESNDIEVEVAFQVCDDFNESIYSFCNNINTQEGGSHVTGFKTALTRIVNKYAKDLNLFKGKVNLDGKDIRSGLTAIVSIKHRNPQFEGQTKTKLGNSDAKTAVEDIFNKEGELYFDRNITVITKLVEKAIKAFDLRKNESKARENFLAKAGTIMPSKLTTCRLENNPAKNILTEIYLVEGDSAGGSAKDGRNPKTQAILPLKGKILNTEKSSAHRMLENEEVLSMVSAFGCGFGEGFGNDFDIKKLKYDKIIIMTDADVDGAHIRTLLLTFFYRFMHDLIVEGKVYIAQPPFYKVIDKGSKKGETKYLYSDKELENHLKSIKNRDKVTVQRFKGLGEMNPEQLWDTTMDPEQRTLLRVTIDDAIYADQLTSVLMGSEVAPRRAFIEEESTNALITT